MPRTFGEETLGNIRKWVNPMSDILGRFERKPRGYQGAEDLWDIWGLMQGEIQGEMQGISDKRSRGYPGDIQGKPKEYSGDTQRGPRERCECRAWLRT